LLSFSYDKIVLNNIIEDYFNVEVYFRKNNMIYIDLIFGLVGVIYGPYLFLKGKGKRSKPVGIIIFLLGLSFLFRFFTQTV